MRLTVGEAKKRLADLEAEEAGFVRKLEEAVESDDTSAAFTIERILERVSDELSFVRAIAEHGEEGRVYMRAP